MIIISYTQSTMAILDMSVCARATFVAIATLLK
jgi:hypothetical protein